MGHEAIGVVEEVGGGVERIKPGQVVIMPFVNSDGTCLFCEEGLPAACVHRGFFGNGGDLDGAQAEALRIPMVDGTLYPLDVGEDDALMILSDAMGTGHHAAVTARVQPGGTVAVVGDGAVGICGVLAAKRLGAEQIIILGRHADRIAPARDFGATDVVSERGEEGIARVRELTGGFGGNRSSNVSAPPKLWTRRWASSAREARSGASASRIMNRSTARSRSSTTMSASAAAPRRHSPTSTSFFPTCSKAASTPAGSSTAPWISTACPTAIAR